MEWKAQEGPQTFALQQPDDINEIFYGGQRGGGKTDTGLVWMAEPVNNPNYRGLVIRKNADDLSDWIDRAQVMYKGLGVDIAYRPAKLRFPNGSKILTGHLKDSQAYTKYQGHEYHRILIEEATQIPDEKRYLMLRASNRSKYPELKPQMMLNANPGGVGHAWVKKRFISEAPPYQVYIDNFGQKRIYIPASIEDNPALMNADPNYVRQLDALKDTDIDLWKAWRMGDWSIIAGQAFREWNALFHVNPDPPAPLNQCKKFISFDWGFSNWGVAVWIAIAPENQYGVQHMYVYRELWLKQHEPREWAKQFKMLQKIDGVKDAWLPPDCFNKEMGMSIAEIFHTDGGLNVREAKTPAGSRHLRKSIMHSILVDAPDGKPYLTMHTNCKLLAESIPELIVDENDPEDIDTDGNDHGYDALTVGLLMEAPKFAQSSGVKPMQAPQIFQRNKVWSPGARPGEIGAPDIMSAVAEYQTRNHGRLRAR